MNDEDVFHVEGVCVFTSTQIEAKVLLIVTTEDNSKPDEKIKNKYENDLANKTLSSFFNFQETTFTEKIDGDNLEDKHGILEALGKVASLEKEPPKGLQRLIIVDG